MTPILRTPARGLRQTRGALWRQCGRRLARLPWSAALALASLLLAAALVTAPLAGCGGGVGEEGTGYASGPITGFGSVIVNDIVFDDAEARVEDGDGTARARAELRLGMTVEVESGLIRSGGARASRLRFDSAVRGPVEQVQAGGFVVLGQQVTVDATTVYDRTLAAGLAALAPGQVVEVYGLFDSGSARFRATRVERRPADFALVYRLRGVVTQLGVGNTLRVGEALFGYGSAANVPANLQVGSFVRLVVGTTPDAFGRWTVLRFGEVQRPLADVEGASVKGFITSFTSAGDLRVDGRPVDARAATVTGGTLALGVRVEVSGALRGGLLVANRVEVRSDAAERAREFELRGDIESVAADRTSIELRGITIGLARPELTYINGTAANLVPGRSVEVRGVVSLNDGARLDALQVRFR